jgi:hypothetical protein
MSGSNSSAPDSSAVPLDLTVHATPAADDVRALSDLERTRRGRWMMLFVVLLCALPVIASYLSFYVFKPRGNAYGDLIASQPDIPADLPLTNLQGHSVDPKSLRHQWLIVVVDGGSCVGSCEAHLFMQRQLREMQGRDRDRIDKVWFVTDDAPISPALQKALATNPATTVLRVPAEALAAWLKPDTGQALAAHLYLVDPMGRWMWRAPPQPDPVKIKDDMKRLLKASNSWDQAGRP